MRCPRCGRDNPDDFRFCPRCGVGVDGSAPEERRAGRGRRRDYLGWSIVSLIFCTPLALLPLVASILSRKLYRRRAYDRAEVAAKVARVTFWWTLGIGLIIQGVYVTRHWDEVKYSYLAALENAYSVWNLEAKAEPDAVPDDAAKQDAAAETSETAQEDEPKTDEAQEEGETETSGEGENPRGAMASDGASSVGVAEGEDAGSADDAPRDSTGTTRESDVGTTTPADAAPEGVGVTAGAAKRAADRVGESGSVRDLLRSSKEKP